MDTESRHHFNVTMKRTTLVIIASNTIHPFGDFNLNVACPVVNFVFAPTQLIQNLQQDIILIAEN